MRHRRASVSHVIGLVIAQFIVAAPAAAQQQGVTPSSESKWTVTFYGGFVSGGAPTSGSGFLPAAGETFIPVPDFPPSRRVSTWWLGDGTTLVNDVYRLTTIPGLPSPTAPPALTALDPVLTSATSERGNGPSFGARVTRTLTRHLDLEVGLDFGLQSLSLTHGAINQIQSTRASFHSTFDTLLARLSRTDRTVSAEATIPEAHGSQTAVTGTVLYNFRPGHKTEPYIVAGGGWLKSGGEVEYTLVGRYSFTSGPALTGETDTLRVVSEWSNSPLGIVGAGIRRSISGRSGVSADVRLQFASPDPRTHIEATPARDPATSQSFGAILFVTTPSLAIIGANPLGWESTLSGPPITDFTTFQGTGTFMSVNVTFGYFLRF